MKILNTGYVAITSLLIIAAVVLAIATSVALLGIGEGQSALALNKGEDSLQFVEGCTEDALLKSKQNASYAGGNITRPEGTCSITVSKAGSTWTVTASTTATTYKRTIQVIFTRTGSGITLTSWTEI